MLRMTYLALARKWRPRTFSTLIGQEHISKPLINALNLQRLHHAYLFTGTRGVGKTSVARILAKALNCETGISAYPCLACDACLSIEQGRFVDLIEIDGASKTKVEDTRDLLDNVQYAPSSGRFKIYLIDEVHMLSQHSFNALLKTLEEPPSHVKFILATTDPQKLPVTVLSRCLQFNLNHLPAELIQEHLQSILKEEQLDYEVEAVSILATAAQGSMRDALSLLDQAITGCNEILLASELKTILGYTQQDYALQILTALAAQNASLFLSISQQVAKEGGHFHYVLDEIINYLHQICIFQSVGSSNPLIKPTNEIMHLASQFSEEDIQLFYQIGIKGRAEISLAPTVTIGFNMTLLRMLTFRPAPQASLPDLAFQLSNSARIPTESKPIENEEQIVTHKLEHQVSAANSAKNSTYSATGHALHEQEPQKETRPVAKLEPKLASASDSVTKSGSAIQLDHTTWAQLIPQLKLTGIALTAVENAEFISKIDRIVTLKVAKGHQSLFTPTILNRLEATMSQYFNSTIKIQLNTGESIQTSPAQQKEKVAQEKQQKATTALHNDDVFQQLQKDFSAELVKNSIVPLKDDI